MWAWRETQRGRKTQSGGRGAGPGDGRAGRYGESARAEAWKGAKSCLGHPVSADPGKGEACGKLRRATGGEEMEGSRVGGGWRAVIRGSRTSSMSVTSTCMETTSLNSAHMLYVSM